MKSSKRSLTSDETQTILETLKLRFENNLHRHKGMKWTEVQARLDANPAKLWSLHQMETSGGEPDVVGHNPRSGEFLFFDCSAESPKGRRSLSYDREGQESRKEHKPKNNALDVANNMGIDLLTEEQYRDLQKLGEFDKKTSSWILTPPEIRSLGGALFCDRRYDHVFVYHNGAQSYYAARGFRGAVWV